MTTGPVLVTGCAGFIGSTLVDRLLAAGREVAGIDAFEPFYPRATKERNLRSALASSSFRFRELDTRDRDRLHSYVTEVRPTTIVDLAARAGVRDSLLDPWLYIDINVRGLQNLLFAAAKVGAPFVFASSSSVYGSSTAVPFHEDLVSLRPISPYGATKLAGEALLAAHHAITGLPTRVARLFTVYGPRQRPDLAVHKFTASLVAGRPIPVYGDGMATRDYTFVGDVVEGLVDLVDAESTDLTVNLAGGHPYTTIDVIRELEVTFGLAATIEHLPSQQGDVRATAADITRASEALEWVPQTGLPDGLALFRDWFRAQITPAERHAAD